MVRSGRRAARALALVSVLLCGLGAMASLAAGCAPGGSGGGGGGRGGRAGGASGAGGAGPAVVERQAANSVVLSPFPDDRLATADPTSPTGLRVSVPSFPDDTDFARRGRADFARIEGFGVLAPIEVSFDGDLDLATVRDDTVAVVNADPTSPRFGERAPLDLGRGSYPTDLGRPVSHYGRDPYAASGDLLYPPGNGPRHFEAATHTLVLRPLFPLAEGARHVVVLTDGVRGTAGDPIRAPAGWRRPAADDAALGPALAAAARYQWSFTTGLPTRELRAIADGIDGRGPLASLAAAYPPGIERFDDLGLALFDGSPYTFDAGPVAVAAGALANIARSVAGAIPAAARLAGILDIFDASALAYVAFGTARGPDLMTAPGGRFDIDLAAGRAAAAQGRIPFLVAVPRPCAANGYAQAPYPVVIFGHGNSRSRLDGLAIAGEAARHGYAVLAFDAVGHGPDDALARVLAPLSGFPMFRPLAREGRATDVDGDGFADSGATFFTADVFRTRDIVRQTVADVVTVRRALDGLGADRNGNGRLDPEEGDVDQDGALDFGGPGGEVHYLGQSLGGIVGGIYAAVEPRPAGRAVLNVPGGCLADVIATSDYFEIVSRVFDEAFGAAIVGDPDPAGGAHVEVATQGPVGRVATAPGGAVEARNARSGTVARAAVAADGGFRVHLAVDRGDGIDLVSFDPAGARLGAIAFTAAAPGLGCERATPRMREWSGFAAVALEPADAACFAPLWRLRPPPGRAPADVLVQASLGDRTVPVFTAAALGRAGGLVSLARNDLLVREGVLASGVASNVDRAFGVESTRDAGIRFLGVNSHGGMILPDTSHFVDGARYAAAIKRQALVFLATGAIDDADPILDHVMP